MKRNRFVIVPIALFLFIINLYAIKLLGGISQLSSSLSDHPKDNRTTCEDIPSGPELKDTDLKNVTETVETSTTMLVEVSSPRSSSEPTPLDLKPSFVNLMHRRSNRIRQYCDAKFQGLTPYPSVSDVLHLFALEKRGFIWCPVFKAASSTWLEYVVALSKVKLPRKLKNQWPIEKAKFVTVQRRLRLDTVKRIMMPKRPSGQASMILVRHPFERLVSAFRDKLERSHEVDYYQKKYGQKIIRKFRTEAIRVLGESYFNEENNFGAPIPVVPSERRKDASFPSFWEFVQFLKRTPSNYYDEHWKPMSLYCMLCKQAIHYNYVIKYEHLQEEQDSFIHHMEWKELYSQENNVINPSNRNNLSSSDVTDLYLKNISDEDLMSLYRIYRDDFLLFDYSFSRGNLTLPPSQDLQLMADLQSIKSSSS